jgi:uncharacterized surface protein with fasciclin (FAS1) repeats
MKSFAIPVLLVLLALVVAACAPQAPVATEAPAEEPAAEQPMEEFMPTIVDLAVENGNFSTLVTALEAAGLVETLQGEGPFTVFAPTDEAFAALPAGALEGLLADPEALKSVLLYHVLGGALKAADVVGFDGTKIESLSGEPFEVKLDGDNVLINQAKVITTDLEGSNGVIHVIDAVILPPSMMAKPSIVDIAIENGNFTTLVKALEAAGLVDTLKAEGPFTVFAPTDEAFAALPEGALDGLLADPEALKKVLLYHVVDGKVLSADAIGLAGQSVETLSGDSFNVKLEGDKLMINEAAVTTPDIEGSNGVIHVIDSVILPPAEETMGDKGTIVDIAVADGRFTTLVTALTEAGLAEALQAEGPFTVFAPTDDAFAALPEGTLDALIADKEALSNVLLYHVAEGKNMAADVVELNGKMLETLLGQYVDIAVEGENVTVDQAKVVITDIEADNGVIHVIDAVLLPETRTIAEIAAESEDFSTLVTALEAAGLVEALQGEGPFTVFAPTNDAFAALPAGALDGLLADIDALTNVLLYHVADGKVMSFQVVEMNGQQVVMLSGAPVTITIDGDTVKINDSVVTTVDIEASNGVIHVIDAVLLP